MSEDNDVYNMLFLMRDMQDEQNETPRRLENQKPEDPEQLPAGLQMSHTFAGARKCYQTSYSNFRNPILHFSNFV